MVWFSSCCTIRLSLLAHKAWWYVFVDTFFLCECSKKQKSTLFIYRPTQVYPTFTEKQDANEDLLFFQANNSAIRSAAAEFVHLKKKENGDGQKLPHFICSSVEHDATLAMLDHLEKEGSAGSSIRPFAALFDWKLVWKLNVNFLFIWAEVTRVDVDPATGSVRTEDIMAAVRPSTVMVTLMLANNETGVIFDIASVAR